MGFIWRHLKRLVKIVMFNLALFAAGLVTAYAIMMVRYDRQKAEPEKVHPAPPKERTMDEIFSRLEDIPFRPIQPGFLGLLKGAYCNGPVILLDAARPTAAKIFPYPPEFEKVTFESFDGTPLAAMVGVHRDGKVRPGLVITHGFMGSKHEHYIIETALTAYADWGFNVVALDYRNMGESQKLSHTPSTPGWKEGQDILAAARHLGDMDEVSTVGAMGFSMGAGSVMSAAHQNKEYPYLTGGAVAVNGYSDSKYMVDYIGSHPGIASLFLPVYYFFRVLHFIRRQDMKTYVEDPEMRAYLELPYQETDYSRYMELVSAPYYGVEMDEIYERSSSMNFLGDVGVPLLILHAEDDLIIPVAEMAKIEEQAATNPMTKIWVLPTGNHCAFRYFDRDWWNDMLDSFFSYWAEWQLEPANA